MRGIQTLHEKGIVHTDIKPNNNLIESKKPDQNGDVIIEQVMIADLEDAAYVLEGCIISGRQVGNWMWRSPEAHASAEVHTASDMFSFGLVVSSPRTSGLLASNACRQCIYAMTKRIIFAVDESEVPEGIELLEIVLKRHLSYFGDLEGIEGLIRYLGDSPWAQLFAMIAADFNADNPRRPFRLWQGIDPVFKNLIVRMMNVDPAQRLTAKEALAHPWFAGCH